MNERKYHPILKPGLYEVVYFGYHPMFGHYRDGYLDITLKQNTKISKLRFLSPVDVVIEDEFNGQVWAYIADISDRQLDHIRIEFGKLEMDCCITFKAYDVIDLNNEGNS